MIDIPTKIEVEGGFFLYCDADSDAWYYERKDGKGKRRLIPTNVVRTLHAANAKLSEKEAEIARLTSRLEEAQRAWQIMRHIKEAASTSTWATPWGDEVQAVLATDTEQSKGEGVSGCDAADDAGTVPSGSEVATSASASSPASPVCRWTWSDETRQTYMECEADTTGYRPAAAICWCGRKIAWSDPISITTDREEG